MIKRIPNLLPTLNVCLAAFGFFCATSASAQTYLYQAEWNPDASNPKYQRWDGYNFGNNYKGFPNAWGVINAAKGEKDSTAGYQRFTARDRSDRSWSVSWGFAFNRLSRATPIPSNTGTTDLNPDPRIFKKAYYAPASQKLSWMRSPGAGRAYTRHQVWNKKLKEFVDTPWVYRKTSYIKSYPSVAKPIGIKIKELSSLKLDWNYDLYHASPANANRYNVMHELVLQKWGWNAKKEKNGWIEGARVQIELHQMNHGNHNGSKNGGRRRIHGFDWFVGRFATYGDIPVYTLTLDPRHVTDSSTTGFRRLSAGVTLDAKQFLNILSQVTYDKNPKVKYDPKKPVTWSKVAFTGDWRVGVVNSGIEIIAGPAGSYFLCNSYTATPSKTSAIRTLSTLSTESDFASDEPVEDAYAELVPEEYLAMYPEVAADPYFSSRPEEHWINYGSSEERYPSFAARDRAESEESVPPRISPEEAPASYQEDSSSAGFTPNPQLDYVIVSESTSGVLSIQDNFDQNNQPLEQSEDTGVASQRWRLESLGDGFIRIVNRQTGKALDANPDGSWTVKQWDYATWAAWHQWRLIPRGEGLYKIQNRHTGKYLTIGSFSTSIDESIGQWTDGGDSPAQVFRLVAELGSLENPAQRYSLQTKATAQAGRSLMLDLLYTNPDNYAQVGQCNWWGGENQKWIFDPVSDFAALSLRNAATSSVLDGDMTGYGVKMWAEYADVDWHDWIIQHLGGGEYRIVNAFTGQSLTMGYFSINPWSPADQSATLIQYPWSGNPAQIWRLNKVD